MATESIGTLIPTAIPGYTDSADIQAALRAYHYGSYSYDPANTSPGSLVTPSIAKTIYDIQADITTLENRPSSGGEVNITQPAATSFTPPEIPDGFIWVDQDGTIGGQPTSATSVFTNSAPTTSLTSGVIWVDKDSTTITANPFIPQALIGAKGDIVVGTANDTASVLSVGTNGFVLSANSATTSGLEWIANDIGDITAVTAGTGISGGGTSGSVTITNDMATTITTNGDLIYGTGSGTYTRRAIGSSGQVLTVSGGVPTWSALPATTPTFIGCIAINSDQNTPFTTVGTEVAIPFAQTEIVDTNGFHDTVTNPSRFTIPTGYGGKYLIQLNIGLASHNPDLYIYILKNGSKLVGSEGIVNGQIVRQVNAYPQGDTFNIGLVVTGVAGDYFNWNIVVQSAGSGTNTIDRARCSFTYLGA